MLSVCSVAWTEIIRYCCSQMGQAVDRFSDITVQHGGMGIAVSVGTSGNIQPLVFDGQCSRNGSP